MNRLNAKNPRELLEVSALQRRDAAATLVLPLAAWRRGALAVL